MFFKFIKFGIVGFSGVFVDIGITYYAKEKLRFNKYVSNSLGFIFATSSNYLLNLYWTFQKNEAPGIIQFGQFFSIALAGLFFNNLIIYALNDCLKLNFYLSKLIAIAIISFWNFYANYYYTFSG